MPESEKKVLDGDGIHRAMIRIAHEILEHNHGSKNLVLVGLRTRGIFLGQRLRREIRAIEDVKLPLGTLDITFYRDDLKKIGPHPTVRETEIPFDLTGKLVVLVDDVLYTGRTIRAALDGVIDFGRPESIQLAVLIDRGHRELPIRADYVGKNIPTSKNEEVIVRLLEKDGTDEVVVREGKKNG